MTVEDVRIKGEEVELNGEKLTILFDFNAFAAMEEVTGKNVEDLLEEFSAGSFRILRLFFWAGLLHERPALTVLEAGKMIDLAKFQEIVIAVGKALQKALPQAQQAQEDADAKKKKK